MRDAVRLWSGRRQLQENELERLRQAWDSGKASGTHGPLDFDDLRQEARRRLAAIKVEDTGKVKEDTGHAG